MSNGHSHVKYLLLGGGSAAASAAEAIRARDDSGEVMLVSTESSRPYHRPPLARGYLRRELRHEDLLSHAEDWYELHQITLRTGVRALTLDLAKRAVTLSTGSEVMFDRLLIATGASARHLDVPGAALPGVMHLRTFEDADRIHHAADVSLQVGKGRVTVIGSGMIAAEVAASLALRPPPARSTQRLAVTLVCPKVYPLEGLVGEYAGRALVRALESLGVVARTGATVRSLEGDGRVQRVVTAPGEPVTCDFAVVAEGWTPGKELLRGTSLSAEKAILVDPRGRTSVEGVFAAGECAAMYDVVFGKHRILDHWDVTVSRGHVVGVNMTGEELPWPGVTVHRAEIGPYRVAVMGEPRFADRRVVRDAGEQGLAEVAVDAEGRVCAVTLVDWRASEEDWDALVRHRARLVGREDQLRDPGRPIVGWT